MISIEAVQKLMESSAKLADAVEKHLRELPADTEMTIALHELRLAQASFDKDLMQVLQDLEKESLLLETDDDKLKQRH